MAIHLKVFEQKAGALMERLEAEEGARASVELARTYGAQDRWLAAWAALSTRERAGKAEAVLENERVRLCARVVDRVVYIVLLDKRSGRTFAEGPYLYRLEVADGQRRTVTELLDGVKIDASSEGEMEISGRIEGAAISQRLRLGEDAPYVEEKITLRNDGDRPLHITKIKLGMTVPVQTAQGRLLDSARGQRWVAAPFRRDTLGRNGEYEDYSVEDLLRRRGWYRVVCVEKNRLPSDDFGAEGWVCTTDEGSLLVVKYSQDQMEFSLLAVESLEEGTYVRFGGCGIFHGDPECLSAVKPGDEIRFGVTRYELVDGGWREGYYAFRKFMKEKGHGVPEGFDPPVHWNELYDNKLFWSRAWRSEEEIRKKYYGLKDMKEEAAKAKELGCEALYLDPGWDKPYASSIWAEERLGKAEDFVKLMADKYGLQVSLWVPLAAWRGDADYPPEADRLDEEGKRVESKTCSGSSAFLDMKSERLLKLFDAGVSFIMFDGSKYTGPCCDKKHGHPIPYTREAHCRAYYGLARRIHRKYPKVQIEMHDMFGGGTMLRYCPIYYLHGLEGSFDELWGFEYMWRPMEDLLKGWAISLYYYNLAYELPLYLHIDLRTDNANALQFWWYASTCRHLGIGGTHPDPAVRSAHKAAMARYMGLKEFYTQGRFYGLDECIHLHVLPEKKAMVVNMFNLEEHERRVTGVIDLDEVGIKEVRFRVGHYYRQVSENKVMLDQRMSARSASVIELWPC